MFDSFQRLIFGLDNARQSRKKFQKIWNVNLKVSTLKFFEFWIIFLIFNRENKSVEKAKNGSSKSPLRLF